MIELWGTVSRRIDWAALQSEDTSVAAWSFKIRACIRGLEIVGTQSSVTATVAGPRRSLASVEGRLAGDAGFGAMAPVSTVAAAIWVQGTAWRSSQGKSANSGC